MKKSQKEVDSSNIPLEVELVTGVKKCETCKWFWGDDKPYGPYPSYDFTKKFPEEVLQEYDKKNHKPIKWMNVKTKALKFIEPAIMSGCRKAPIMTIGINPNLTAFRPGPVTDTWAYPKFSDEASYAYYYRHRTIYQESFSSDFLSTHLSKNEGDIIRAKNDGWLTYSNRSNTSRWLMLTLEYKDKTQETIECTWKQYEDYFVNFSSTKINSKIQFKKGDVIAAKLHLNKNVETPVYHNITGYYERFISVLDDFKKVLENSANEKNNLKEILGRINFTIGEDVAQHDMIACASPGWTSIYDIPNDRVIQNCVQDNSWVVKQVIQSQPQVIVLVGGSSLSMFLDIFGPFTKLKTKAKDYFQLIRRTCEEKYYLDIKIGKFAFRSRLICSPHFSYGDNFRKQFRFLNDEWKAFQNKFPDDFKYLENLKDVEIAESYDSIYSITLKKGDNGDVRKIAENLNPDAKIQLMAHYYDVNEMMAQALKQEYDSGVLKLDLETGHLKRTEGPCHFCDNELWKFPEGCEYKKSEEPRIPASYYLDIVKEIINSSKKYNKIRKEKMENAINEFQRYKSRSF